MLSEWRKRVGPLNTKKIQHSTLNIQHSTFNTQHSLSGFRHHDGDAVLVVPLERLDAGTLRVGGDAVGGDAELARQQLRHGFGAAQRDAVVDAVVARAGGRCSATELVNALDMSVQTALMFFLSSPSRRQNPSSTSFLTLSHASSVLYMMM